VNLLAVGGLSLTNADLPVTALVPDGTTIMGTDAWDGKIKFIPVALAGSDIPAGFKVKGQAVEIGSTTSSLVFSKPVKIDFANAECAWSATNVTCDVSYKSAGQATWVNVPKCTAEVEKDPNKLSFGKECYIPMSNKTVIVWTYHFSQFARTIVIRLRCTIIFQLKGLS
jgi:hypothetical protein